MDILTHALSGTAVATCAATFVKATPMRKARIVAVGTLGGMLPDIDAISMWSHFDSTFGKLFALPYSGKVVYSSKLWYSHHAFFHSLAAGLLLGMLLLLAICLMRRSKDGKAPQFSTFFRQYFIYFIAFVLGYWAHLAGDLPTPASAWGGIALWWPSAEYVGGYGKIWWWNNYDIFLLIVCCIFVNLGVPAFRLLKNYAKMFTSAVLGLTIILIAVQMNTRQYDYAYTRSIASTYAQMEQNSKKEQERILGKRLYRYMERFDRMMKFYF